MGLEMLLLLLERSGEAAAEDAGGFSSGGIGESFQQRLHVAARSAAAEGEREEHAAVPATAACRRAAHALEHHVVSLPQIGQLLQHHLLRRRRLRAAAASWPAADLVLPEPRRQQRGLVVQPPKLLLHPLRLRAALRRLPACRGGQVGAGRRRQAAEHLVEEVVVPAAGGTGGRAEVVEGDLAGSGHGLHFPRRGLYRSLAARVYESAGG
uniref:Uncharacterized protein n=1 Tax=Arundo donax TaxID=35708 RepID=A0A0A9GH33_ARUDO